MGVCVCAYECVCVYVCVCVWMCVWEMTQGRFLGDVAAAVDVRYVWVGGWVGGCVVGWVGGFVIGFVCVYVRARACETERGASTARRMMKW